MSDSVSTVEQDVETDAQTDSQEVMSDARTARKEAQTLVSTVQNQASQVASLIRGKSGLAAEEKADILGRAHALAQELRAEAEKVEAALERAVSSL